ncbi:hypothetical protein AE07_00652 [Enterobacter cloacae BWH 43]|nr:hypothetical protein AE07_00652 [Enterobacter cloacae BWH 43]
MINVVNLMPDYLLFIILIRLFFLFKVRPEK